MAAAMAAAYTVKAVAGSVYATDTANDAYTNDTDYATYVNYVNNAIKIANDAVAYAAERVTDDAYDVAFFVAITAKNIVNNCKKNIYIYNISDYRVEIELLENKKNLKNEHLINKSITDSDLEIYNSTMESKLRTRSITNRHAIIDEDIELYIRYTASIYINIYDYIYYLYVKYIQNIDLLDNIIPDEKKLTLYILSIIIDIFKTYIILYVNVKANIKYNIEFIRIKKLENILISIYVYANCIYHKFFDKISNIITIKFSEIEDVKINDNYNISYKYIYELINFFIVDIDGYIDDILTYTNTYSNKIGQEKLEKIALIGFLKKDEDGYSLGYIYNGSRSEMLDISIDIVLPSSDNPIFAVTALGFRKATASLVELSSDVAAVAGTGVAAAKEAAAAATGVAAAAGEAAGDAAKRVAVATGEAAAAAGEAAGKAINNVTDLTKEKFTDLRNYFESLGANQLTIENVYEIYYKYNIEDNLYFINDLILQIGNSETIIYLLLLIFNNSNYKSLLEQKTPNEMNTNIIQIYKTFLDTIKIQYEYFKTNDIILKNRYTNDELIYYIFINYLYNSYNKLLDENEEDITFTINIDDKSFTITENYHEIYKKLNEVFTNRDIIIKIIKYLKHYMNIAIETDEIIENHDYLISFIYKYSKEQSPIILEGYDEFITIMYLNLLNKITDIIKINEITHDVSKLQTLDIYDFSDLNKDYTIILKEKQQEILCNEIILDKKLLVIIQDKYKIPNIKIDNQYNFKINTDILDIINSLREPIITDIPKIDLKRYIKLTEISIIESKLVIERENIIYYILYLAAYIFKDNNEIKTEIYCKLVYCYLYLINNKYEEKIINLTYQLIYKMYLRTNKKISNNKLLRCAEDIIKKSFSISLKDLNKFSNPEYREIDNEIFDNDLLELLEDIYIICSKNKLYSSFNEIFVPYFIYYNDKYDMQIRVQNLLCEKIINNKMPKITGGNSKIQSSTSGEIPTIDNDRMKELFPDDFIDLLDKNIEKINKKIEEDNNKINDFQKSFNNTIELIIKSNIDNNLIIEFAKAMENDKENEEAIKTYTDTGKFNDKLQDVVNMLNSKKEDIDITFAYSIKSKCENKLTDLKNFKEKDIATIKTKITIKNIEPYLNEITKLFDIIKKNPDIQTSNPIIKRIYNAYIKPEDDEKNPVKIVKDIYSDFIDTINEYLNNLDIITDRIKQIVKTIENLISSNEKIKKRDADIYYRPRNKDEDKKDEKKEEKKGGGENKTEKLKKNINDLKSSFKDIKTELKRLKSNRILNSDPEKKMAAPGFIDKEEYNIFDRLIASYDNDYNNKNIPHELTNNLFYSKVKAKSLDPAEELAIDTNDKIIFLVLAYFIRLGATYICYHLININIVTDIIYSLYYYIIFYLTIFLLLIIVVNIDTFKLRILFNYMNLHINTTDLYTHAILMTIFVYLIYLLVININGDENPPTELTEPEKIKLKYKLDLLTIIIYIFICILIFII